MLRVEIRNSADTWSLILEGRFTGDDAEHARMLITGCPVGAKLIVDLTEVVFIDNVGEEVLSFFGRFGAEFTAPSSYTLDVCGRLNLLVAPNGTAPKNGSCKPDTNVRQSGFSGRPRHK
jgi:hypothetical protein